MMLQKILDCRYATPDELKISVDPVTEIMDISDLDLKTADGYRNRSRWKVTLNNGWQLTPEGWSLGIHTDERSFT